MKDETHEEDHVSVLPSLGRCQRCKHNRYEPLRDYPAWMSCQCPAPDFKPPAAALTPPVRDDYWDC